MGGRITIITGASRGIGAAAARAFAQAGHRVALLARSMGEIEALAAEIGSGRSMALGCDVADFDAVEAAFAAVERAWGRPDVLIGNAGVIEPVARLEDADPAAWGRVIDVNLKGVMHGMRAALPRMLAGGGGTVLTISSGAAHRPVEGWSHYCASKAGAAMLTRCLDEEHRGNGIRAMGLSPGTVATRMQREIRASGINPVSRLDWSAHVPPEWPARALVWMAGPSGDRFLGEEVSLRDEAVRRELGLTA
ncbi:NADP-dependent 3-hydroxy acid dehydrogenase YdfG [Hasllibacter halocynthiae]|uniref:NADP-dependent 3-hydroxy acid dehydrogenase YdfG n=1 Tax=Hasllibacter halocynthiae TaxID=595589 RepID=A0A2T0X1H6_9RHOB|nr:SDR family oxidoreductase [Hasllibacter halocynthiae]PRY92791.1 NADP-dependent 3-hydroxy acid dehydrogenase YdfG [Hasllibacter halocynthiae]